MLDINSMPDINKNSTRYSEGNENLSGKSNHTLPNEIPGQTQEHQPGIEKEMSPRPISVLENYAPANKLKDKIAIITGGDSGIGRSVAYHFILEGAKVIIVYYPSEKQDALETKQWIEEKKGECKLLSGDITQEDFCNSVVSETVKYFGKIDILVNNAGEQYENMLDETTSEKLEHLFRTNVFSYIYFAKASYPHMKKGSSIINTTSVVAYKGSHHLIDYSATKGAIVTLTRSWSQALINKRIRVNAVAPGPIWTPLIPATFSEDKVEEFGKQFPMKRPGQPGEIAPSYVFLASSDSSYITGQILHPNGGLIVGS